MSDGIGCKCWASCASECCCDNVDWTPQIVYDQQKQLAEREKQIMMLRERIEWILEYQSRPNNKGIKEQARAGHSGAQAFEMVCYELKSALDATQDLEEIKK
jgi:hypothetical protein